MKKIIALALTLCLCVSFAACSKSKDNTTNQTSNTTQSAQPTAVETTSKIETTAETTITQTDAVDLDLTELSSTVVYSEVYNMLSAPDDYRGKLIKMKGQFNQYYDDETKATYNAVIIPDATACCQQGLEFQLADKSNPNFEQGTEITVVGSFNTYNEGEYTYCYLQNAQIVG